MVQLCVFNVYLLYADQLFDAELQVETALLVLSLPHSDVFLQEKACYSVLHKLVLCEELFHKFGRGQLSWAWLRLVSLTE